MAECVTFGSSEEGQVFGLAVGRVAGVRFELTTKGHEAITLSKETGRNHTVPCPKPPGSRPGFPGHSSQLMRARELLSSNATLASPQAGM